MIAQDVIRVCLVAVVAYLLSAAPVSSTALPSPMPIKGNGSPKRWIPGTPAMSGSVITDHVWMMKKSLSCLATTGSYSIC
jgi:hypothetical protein